MTSKELNEILNKTRRTSNISLTPKQVEEIIKDLEVLEILTNNLDYNNHYKMLEITMYENSNAYNNVKKWCINNKKFGLLDDRIIEGWLNDK